MKKGNIGVWLYLSDFIAKVCRLSIVAQKVPRG
jgi:hypothetical protein